MKRNYVLAAVALTLTAGTLTPAYAQNRTEDQPDAFELRRALLDRIEAAYTEGDTATLQRMEAAERRLELLVDMSTQLRDLADLFEMEATQSRPGKPAFDGLNNVCSAVHDHWAGCDVQYDSCMSSIGEMMVGMMPGSFLCGIQYFFCYGPYGPDGIDPPWVSNDDDDDGD